jgi:hypothetical protein
MLAARRRARPTFQRPRVTSRITETCRGVRLKASSEESPAVPPPTSPKGPGRPHELLVVAAAASSSLRKSYRCRQLTGTSTGPHPIGASGERERVFRGLRGFSLRTWEIAQLPIASALCC